MILSYDNDNGQDIYYNDNGQEIEFTADAGQFRAYWGALQRYAEAVVDNHPGVPDRKRVYGVPDDIEIDGNSVTFKWEYSLCGCCGSGIWTYDTTLDEIFNGQGVGALVATLKAEADVKRCKAEEEAAAEQQRRQRAQEERDRQEFERLRAKFDNH